MNSVARSGDFAYVGDMCGVIHVVDISDRTMPHVVTTLNLPGESIRRIHVADGLLYVADESGGVQILDISEENAPRMLGSAILGDSTLDFAVGSDRLFVPGGQTLTILPTQCRAQFGLQHEERSAAAVGAREDLAAYWIGATPNPARVSTVLSFRVEREAPVSLAVYDLSGRQVRTLWSGSMASGGHELTWDGRDDQGRTVSTGTYFARLNVAGEVSGQRLLWIR